MGQNRGALNVAIPFVLGIGLVLGLFYLLGAQLSPVSAAAGVGEAAQVARSLQASGNVITVCLSAGCDFDSVQGAVDAASEGDEIRVATGTYTGVSERAGVTQVVYISRSVTIRGGYTTTNWSEPNPMSAPTTLDAEGEGRVLFIATGVSPTIEGLRITGGNAWGLKGGPYGQDGGGGVYVGAGGTTISGCQVVSNIAQGGGGIYVVDGAVTLIGNNVLSNTARKDSQGFPRGGGVYLRGGEAMLTDNVFRANSAEYGGGLHAFEAQVSLLSNRWVGNRATSYGGAVDTSYSAPTFRDNTMEGNTATEKAGGLSLYESDATVVGNTFRANTARWGGGLFQEQGTLVFSRNVVISNTATSGAGGMCVDEEGFAVVADSTFLANSALERVGGGLYLLRNSEAILTNTIIADNYAAGSGAGLYMWGGATRLVHTTLARNGHREGGLSASGHLIPGDAPMGAEPQAASEDAVGVYVRDGEVSLVNAIVVGHDVGLYVYGGAAASLESTLWGSDGWANGVDWSGPGTIEHVDDYWGDPAFVDPDAGDYHIGSFSAAVDRGVDAGVREDIDGNPRPLPVGGGFDLGADEYAEIDLSASSKRVHPGSATVDEVVTYTIVLVNEGDVNSRGTRLVDAIPTQTTYISGSAMTSAGVLTDSDSIRWSGTLTPHQPVTITFAVTLGEASLVRNTAVVTDEKGSVTTMWALVNGQRLYIPFILR